MNGLMQVDASITNKKCAITTQYSKVLVELLPGLPCVE